MAAPLKNEFYKLRSIDGRSTKLTKQELFDGANDYFEWVMTHPLKEQQIIKFKDSHKKIKVNKLRAMTIGGLCVFLDIGLTTFKEYALREDFAPIVARIRNVILTQKFEGAAAGLLKENLIAAELGIKSKQEISLPSTHKELSQNEIKQIAQSIKDSYGSLPAPKTIDIDHEEIKEPDTKPDIPGHDDGEKS